MQFFKNNWFKILAILFLLWALANNSYSYYQFLRWAILIIGAYSSYLAYNMGRNGWTWIFVIIAILFNPIVPFTFQRDTWQIIDVSVAIIFFFSLFIKHEKD
jgi:low affinity Fe/Cu permease